MLDWRHNDKLKDEKLHGKGTERGDYRLEPCVVPYKGLRQFNATQVSRDHAGIKKRMSLRECPRELDPGEPLPSREWNFMLTSHYFGGDGLQDKLARALAKREAIDIKEFAESIEFFTHVRKHKGPGCRDGVVVDLCCGHGFTGLLFAVFEQNVTRVILADRMRPPAFDKIWDAVLEVAPWVEAKVTLLFGPECGDLGRIARDPLGSGIPPGATVLAVHACGLATDICLRIGLDLNARCIALLPCCHRPATMTANARSGNPLAFAGSRRGADVFWGERQRPQVLENHLGRGMSCDIHRTYELHEAGYSVHWGVLPPEVTPKNRLVIACLPAPGKGKGEGEGRGEGEGGDEEAGGRTAGSSAKGKAQGKGGKKAERREQAALRAAGEGAEANRFSRQRGTRRPQAASAAVPAATVPAAAAAAAAAGNGDWGEKGAALGAAGALAGGRAQSQLQWYVAAAFCLGAGAAVGVLALLGGPDRGVPVAAK